MENKVFEEIKKIIKAKYGKDVQIDTVLSETGIDSLDLLDLVIEAESNHGVKIEDDELLNLKTIGDVVKAIASKL